MEIQFLRDGVWETEYTMDKNTKFSTLSTDWTLFNMNIISQPNYGLKIVYSGINSANADMCFNDINITRSNFQKTHINVYNHRKCVIEYLSIF